MTPIDLNLIRDVLQAALKEDIGTGDVTSRATILESATATARYTTKQPLVVSGLPVVAELVGMVDSSLKFNTLTADGDYVETGTALAEMRGSARSVLGPIAITRHVAGERSGKSMAT